MQKEGKKRFYMNTNKKGCGVPFCQKRHRETSTTIMLWSRSSCLCVGIQKCRSTIESFRVHQILCFADKTGGTGKEYSYLHVLLALQQYRAGLKSPNLSFQMEIRLLWEFSLLKEGQMLLGWVYLSVQTMTDGNGLGGLFRKNSLES